MLAAGALSPLYTSIQPTFSQLKMFEVAGTLLGRDSIITLICQHYRHHSPTNWTLDTYHAQAGRSVCLAKLTQN